MKLAASDPDEFPPWFLVKGHGFSSMCMVCYVKARAHKYITERERETKTESSVKKCSLAEVDMAVLL